MKIFLPILLFLSLLCIPPHTAIADDGRLSTHILDISRGEPAPEVTISLFRWNEDTGTWGHMVSRQTDQNGRVSGLLAAPDDHNGIYKLRFETAAYFEKLGQESIYPYVEVPFLIKGQGHYHIPITLSANGYATYRGN